MLKGCGSFPGSNILMVECLPEVEAQPQPLLWCPSGDKSVVFIQIFTLTSRSLHLLVEGQLISSISFEMFRCSLSFSSNLELGSPSSGLSDSTFLIPSSALLRRMLFFVIHSYTDCSHEQFKCLSLTKKFWKSPLDLFLFLVFQTIRMQLIS